MRALGEYSGEPQLRDGCPETGCYLGDGGIVLESAASAERLVGEVTQPRPRVGQRDAAPHAPVQARLFQKSLSLRSGSLTIRQLASIHIVARSFGA